LKPVNSYVETKLLSGKYRYEGRYGTLHFCIHSVKKKSHKELREYLSSCSLNFLIKNEGYIIEIKGDR